MDTQRVLKRLDAAWADFEASYVGLSESQLLIRASRANGRSRHHRARDLVGGRGAEASAARPQRRHLSLAEALRQHDDVHARLLAYARAAPEELYARVTRVRRRLRLDTYGHYPLHAKAIRAWRERSHI